MKLRFVQLCNGDNGQCDEEIKVNDRANILTAFQLEDTKNRSNLFFL